MPWFPNSMSRWDKVRHWGHEMAYLLTHDAPDNANGYLFPAILGTVLMVILMSIVVVPLWVIAAIYLNEYAGKIISHAGCVSPLPIWRACHRLCMACSGWAFLYT